MGENNRDPDLFSSRGGAVTRARIGRRLGSALWSLLALALAAAVLAVAFSDLDVARLIRVVGGADGMWIALLAVAVPAEQIVRGWKWRQLLYDIRPVATLRLFGAVMAGYFANMAVPLGVSPLVRAWLVARMENLRTVTVLMTTAIERFVDGVVFAVLVGVLVLFAPLPGAGYGLRLALVAAAVGSLLTFTALLAALFLGKGRLEKSGSLAHRAVSRLERAFKGRLVGLGDAITEGILWPRDRRRAAAIIAASIVMKIIAATHFLWAGLAVGIVLAPFDYLFLLVFVGFSFIVARFVRIPGGFVIGSTFALKLLAVPDEEALTMVMLVYVASMAMTIVIGATALWRGGVTLGELRRRMRAGNG